MNLAAIIDDHPADRPALVDRGATITYGELRKRVAALRAGLTGLGLDAGDRVAIIRDNDAGFVAAYLAILGAGLVAVPLNPQSPEPELTRELDEVGCRAVVGTVAAGEPSWRSVVEHVVAPDELIAASTAREPAPVVERADDDLAVLLYTTGTAGTPKAAMLSHGNLKANIDQLLAHPDLQTADDVVLGVLPLFHIFGLNVMLGLTLATGASLVLVERFEPQAAVDTMAEHGITLLSGPPTLFAALTRLPDTEASSRAFAGVRLAASGAAPLSAEVAGAFQARFGMRLHQGYGLTEASPAVTTTVGSDAPAESIGVPLPGVEVRVVDADGDAVLAGDDGEIMVKGANVFAGYWENDEATRAALTADGWLRTGDVGVSDDNGYLYIIDRAKDVIIVSGFNVHPIEVEEVVMQHPAVQEAAAVGMPDPSTGEAVKVFVVLRPEAGAEADEAALIRFCEAHLARYKCPDAVEFVDQIPRGFAGKLLRRSLG